MLSLNLAHLPGEQVLPSRGLGRWNGYTEYAVAPTFGVSGAPKTNSLYRRDRRDVMGVCKLDVLSE